MTDLVPPEILAALSPEVAQDLSDISSMIDIDEDAGIAQILVAAQSSPEAGDAEFAAAEAQLREEGDWELTESGGTGGGRWAFWARYREV
jgi:hypothetical protein